MAPPSADHHGHDHDAAAKKCSSASSSTASALLHYCHYDYDVFLGGNLLLHFFLKGRSMARPLGFRRVFPFLSFFRLFFGLFPTINFIHP
jgi:hypothetical protein